MKKNSPSHEGGQILVILVLALVALLAFTALAVDVGMAFSDRRNDQNAADSIALAGSQAAVAHVLETYKNDPSKTMGTTDTLVCPGAGWKSTDAPGGDWVKNAMHDAFQAAWERGNKNYFTLSTVDLGSYTALQAAQEGIFVQCVPTIDQSGHYTEAEGIYTYAMVSTNTSTSFAHMIFRDTLRNTVTAISRAQPFYAF